MPQAQTSASTVGPAAAPRRLVVLSQLYFFCVLAAYYMLRPLRDQFSSAVGSTNLWPFWVGVFVAALAVTPVFGFLVKRYPRERFIPVSYGFFIACILAFVPLFAAIDRIGPRLLGIAFYIWLSVFSLFVVSVFWSFMADIFSAEQSRRLFPRIAIGGTVATLIGPFLAFVLPSQWILLAAAALLGACVVLVGILSRQAQASPGRRPEESEVIGGDILGGLRQVFASPLLRKMALLMLLGDAVGTVGYALAADWVKENFVGTPTQSGFAVLLEAARNGAGNIGDFWAALLAHAAYKDAWALIDLATNSFVLLLQLFVTRALLRRFGAGGVIVASQTLNVVVLVATAVIGAAFVVPMLILSRAGTYGLQKPAVDSLYARVPREARYKAKNFIETAVWRFGDMVLSIGMAVLTPVLKPLGIAVSAYALISAGAAVWSGRTGWRAARSPELAPESKSP
jgi:AAA family ATP:ADP antiporter